MNLLRRLLQLITWPLKTIATDIRNEELISQRHKTVGFFFNDTGQYAKIIYRFTERGLLIKARKPGDNLTQFLERITTGLSGTAESDYQECEPIVAGICSDTEHAFLRRFCDLKGIPFILLGTVSGVKNATPIDDAIQQFVQIKEKNEQMRFASIAALN